jgi:Tfp pilus assembly protein PilF
MARHAETDLDRLFAELARASDEDEARKVESKIWRLWAESGVEAADRMLAVASEAMSRGAFAAALALLNSALETTGDFAEAWNKRATLYYLIGEHDLAVHDIRRTLSLEPRHFGAMSGLGMICLQRSDEAGALKAFRDALAVHPYLSGAQDAVDNLSGTVGEGEP